MPITKLPIEEFSRRYVAARRAVVAMAFPELNEAQARAALKTQGAVRILAGAGSGKTKTLIARTANILKFGQASDSLEIPPEATDADLTAMERYAAGDTSMKALAESAAAFRVPNPQEILVVTFTNKAARELRERLRASIGDRGMQVNAMTFHSMGLRMLRWCAPMVNIDDKFMVADDKDQTAIVKNIMQAMDETGQVEPPPDAKPRDVKSALSSLKHAARNTDISAPRHYTVPPAPAGDPYDIWDNYMTAFYNAYQSYLDKGRLMDFDDLILRFYDSLAHPDVCRYCQDMFKYIMVDEYQDTDDVQDAIIRILSWKTGNLCVVGDDDQSIYSFRGANVDIFRRFDHYHPESSTITLHKNYRSTAHIIDAANKMIESNSIRVGKTMTNVREPGNLVRVTVSPDADAEAEAIVKIIRRNVADGMKYSDHVILARYWSDLNAIQPALTAAPIPYDVVNGHTFFNSEEIKRMTAYIRLAINPNDPLCLAKLLPKTLNGVGPAAWDAITAQAAASRVGAIDVMADENLLKALKVNKPGRESCLKFVRFITELNSDVRTMAPGDAIRAVAEKTGYLEQLEYERDCESEDAEGRADARINNVHLLGEMADKFVQQQLDEDPSKTPTLIDFLDTMALSTDIDEKDDKTLNKKPKDRVLLMTIHKSKGLEFPCVIVTDVTEGKLPPSRDDTDVEEERRLFYVAMTRAKDMLHIMVPERGPNFMRQYTALRPSRFLDELPQEDIMIRRN